MENTSTQKFLTLGDREFVLVGTAHVSKASIDEVEKAIEDQRPDTVAVELDEGRLKNLKDENSWKEMDIIKVLKNKMGFLMLANLVLAGYQKRMGENTGSKPGDEMLAAINKADSLGIPFTNADRSVAVTLRRAWAKTSFFGKIRLLTMLVLTAFIKEEVSPDEIENLKETSEMDTMMKDLSSYLPAIKEVLIDERDFYLASKIWQASGKKVLAVLGAGHLPGVVSHLEKFSNGQENPDCASISEVPPAGIGAKILAWAIPAVIVALIAAGFWFGGVEKGKTLLGAWVIWNGALAGIGAIAALAHPVAVAVSVVAAPFTSLCPLIGVGFVSGIVQAVVCKPKVCDMENLSDDAVSVKGFYRNRILKVLVVFLLSSVGSSIGTFVSAGNFIAIFAR